MSDAVLSDAERFIVDHYATMQLKQMAESLGCCWQTVQAHADRLIRQGVLKREDRCYQRPWTDEDEEYLADQWGKIPDTTIATTLKRSHQACQLKAKRLHVSKRDNVMTATDVGEIFGVYSKTVIVWVNRGWIKGTRSATQAGTVPNPGGVGKRKSAFAWHINDESLERFVRTMGWAYDYTMMAEGDYFTRLARQVNKADPWLTVEEVCAIVGVGPEAIRRWCRNGILPHKRRPRSGSQHGPWQGQIVIRKADIPEAVERHNQISHANRSAAAKARFENPFQAAA